MITKESQEIIHNFFAEHGNNNFKEKLILRHNKELKLWQVIKTTGILEEVLFENKDKNLCKKFMREE